MLDFETTGLAYHKHQIIEIAAIRVIPGEGRLPYYHRLTRAPQKLSSRIRELTGITDDLLKHEGCDVIDGVSGLIDFVGASPVASFNAPFDLGFLNAACVRHSIAPIKRAGHSCALALAKRVWPGLSTYRLPDLAARFGLEMDDQHRALGDARRAAQLYRIASFEHGRRTRT